MVKKRHEFTGMVRLELPSVYRASAGQTKRHSRKRILAVGYVASFTAGWVLAGSGNSFNVIVTREAKQVGITEHLPKVPYQPVSLAHILSQRPNWRSDYDLQDWLPSWLSRESISLWKLRRYDQNHQRALDVEMHLGRRDDYFWKTMVDPRNFTFAIASNGFGHRLGNLAMSYLCNVVPNKRQQLVLWDLPGANNFNVAWHELMEDSPILTGVPLQWDKRHRFDYVNRHREQIGRKGEIDYEHKGMRFGSDLTHCDYQEYFPTHDCGKMCRGFDFSRETWLLRLAQEPSAQEFFMLLRAQLRQRVKDKIALFMEENFPPDKLVIGVHVRSGNGKDDGQGDFDKKKRGDWLHDLPEAVTIVRKHARMVFYSVMDRYNHDLDFDMDGYDSTMDNRFRIFLATDSSVVLDEFRRQDPNILYVEQERMKAGGGVPINEPLKCHNKTTTECLIHAEEAMFMDAMIMSSCDVALAESFSNWMYTLPATLRLAEGRIFCENGRAALGVKESDSVYAPAAWWAHPPPNTMPVRCYHGAWAARDRTNLLAVKDVT